MLTNVLITAVRACLAREEGDAMSQVVWSLGLIILAGVLAIVVGPAVGADWREFIGKPTR